MTNAAVLAKTRQGGNSAAQTADKAWAADEGLAAADKAKAVAAKWNRTNRRPNRRTHPRCGCCNSTGEYGRVPRQAASVWLLRQRCDRQVF